MSPVSHGADAARLHEIARSLQRSSSDLDGLVTSGHAFSRVLAEVWSGPDCEHFIGSDWPSAAQGLEWAARTLEEVSSTAERNAGEQEDGSAGTGGGSGVPAVPPPGGSGPGGAADEGQSRDPEEYGDLPPEVREAWEGYSEDERRAIVEQIIKERAEHYGTGMPDINWDEDMSGNGAWLEDWWFANEVYINPNILDDPMILHTVYHEMRHAAQHQAIDDADTFWWWEDPEYHHGMTPEEVQEWEDNFDDYESAPSEEDWEEDPEAAQEQYDRYFEQPVEVDARDEGAEFVEGMTPEELERLLEASK